MQIKVFIGYDARQPLAYSVCARSILNRTKHDVDIQPLLLPHLRAADLYYRRTSIKDGVMFDEISGAPMSTEFAISRFLVPELCDHKGWAIFCDSDFLFMDDIAKLCEFQDERFALMCVHHNYNPGAGTKMDGQQQTSYARKNWSSLMMFNNAHPKNAALDPYYINNVPGRDLHRFAWLDDKDIGEVPESWNWLEGHSSMDIQPQAVHFTRGTPDMPGYENVSYSDDWNTIAQHIREIS